jgi:hypothetical protein
MMNVEFQSATLFTTNAAAPSVSIQHMVAHRLERHWVNPSALISAYDTFTKSTKNPKRLLRTDDRPL